MTSISGATTAAISPVSITPIADSFRCESGAVRVPSPDWWMIFRVRWSSCLHSTEQLSGSVRYGRRGGFISEPSERSYQWRVETAGWIVLGVSAVLSVAGLFLRGQSVRVEEWTAQVRLKNEWKADNSELIIYFFHCMFATAVWEF